MTARIMLGWVDPDDLVKDEESVPDSELVQET
jgi:hypothetical protein